MIYSNLVIASALVASSIATKYYPIHCNYEYLINMCEKSYDGTLNTFSVSWWDDYADDVYMNYLVHVDGSCTVRDVDHSTQGVFSCDLPHEDACIDFANEFAAGIPTRMEEVCGDGWSIVNPSPGYQTGTTVTSAQSLASCNLPGCALVDGGWSSWTTWEENGDNTETRHRYCDSPVPQFGGSGCSGSYSETQTLPVVNGGWSAWSNGNCGETDISTLNSRTCNNPVASGAGLDCYGNSIPTSIVTSCDDSVTWGLNGNDVFKKSGNTWVSVPGSFKQIAVGNGEVWGVKDDLTIWKKTDDTSILNDWVQVAGSASYIGVNNNKVWSLGTVAHFLGHGFDIFEKTDPTSLLDDWVEHGGELRTIFIECDGTVWGENNGGDMYYDGPNWVYSATPISTPPTIDIVTEELETACCDEPTTITVTTTETTTETLPPVTATVTITVTQIDGEWSDWSNWGSCSGSQTSITRTRTCTNPSPSNGGNDCVGSSSENQGCSSCPPFDNVYTGCSTTQGTIEFGGGHTEAECTALCTNASNLPGCCYYRDFQTDGLCRYTISENPIILGSPPNVFEHQIYCP